SGESTIIPVSKVSFGFGIGGGERNASRNGSNMGAGAGAKIEPVAFVVVTGGKAKLLPLKSREATFARLFDLIPDVLEAIQNLFLKKHKNEDHPPVPALREGLKG
ncbi:MAG: GerW family sporulation protein, partial [Candidatus Latescibacterota bacterium]